MKGLGLVGAGLGAAAAATPVFHDLDELASSPNAAYKLAWWVKERDHYNPTAEADWSVIPQSFTREMDGWRFGKKPGDTSPRGIAADQRVAEDNERKMQFLLNNTPGYSVRDNALKQGASVRGHFKSVSDYDVPSFVGYPATTPDDLGVPRYTGTPEENASVVRAGLHFLGMPQVGFLAVDDKTKRLFDGGGWRFENTDEAYQDDKIKVFPNKAKWIIVSMVRKEQEIAKRFAWTPTHPFGYDHTTILGHRAQKFIKALGYQALTGIGPNSAYGVLSGMAELGRINHSVTPKYGTAIRKFNLLVTDLPLPATAPIDAGIYEFCKSCKTCASRCMDFGRDALSMETEPTFEVVDGGNRPGIKNWAINWRGCWTPCGVCHVACPFNQKQEAFIHQIVMAAIATTPLLNSFQANMYETFGYMPKFGYRTGDFSRMEEWWNRDLATYPYDVILSSDGYI